jgi:hypothetical protein
MPKKPSASQRLVVTDESADWVALAREALELAVVAQQRTPPKPKR